MQQTTEYPLHTTGNSYVVGNYLVVIPREEGDPWRVMENFGGYRMLKKQFKTLSSALKRAEAMPAS